VVLYWSFINGTKRTLNLHWPTRGGGGGHYERDLLNRLNIPGVNLEACGCPRAEVLFDQLGWLETCGKHLTTVEAYRHCPKLETEAFGYWLNQNV
jgi:hypothetical protein